MLVEDALFATLDPTVRRAESPDGREYTLTDTVGFVRHLPHQLVDAFRSTLEEVAAADLLLHVVDGSDPDPLGQIDAVRVVLGEIDAASGARGHRRQQGRRDDRGRRPDRCAARCPARCGCPPAPAPASTACASSSRRGCRTRTSRSRCWCPTTGATWSPGCTATARCCEETHEEAGTRLAARVDGGLAAALEEFAVAGRLTPAGGRPRSDGQVAVPRYGDPVTSGVIRDAGAPGRSRVVSVGRPPWWVMASRWSWLAGSSPTCWPAAGSSGSTCGSPRSSAAGGCVDSARLPVVWVVTQLGGRVTILVVLAALVGLPGLAPAHLAAAGPGPARPRPAHPCGLRDQARHRPHRSRLPGLHFFHADGASFPSGHVANAVLMWGIARWQAVEYGLPLTVQRLFWALSVVGPVVAGVAMVSLDFHWVSDAVAGAASGSSCWAWFTHSMQWFCHAGYVPPPADCRDPLRGRVLGLAGILGAALVLGVPRPRGRGPTAAGRPRGGAPAPPRRGARSPTPGWPNSPASSSSATGCWR